MASETRAVRVSCLARAVLVHPGGGGACDFALTCCFCAGSRSCACRMRVRAGTTTSVCLRSVRSGAACGRWWLGWRRSGGSSRGYRWGRAGCCHRRASRGCARSSGRREHDTAAALSCPVQLLILLSQPHRRRADRRTPQRSYHGAQARFILHAGRLTAATRGTIQTGHTRLSAHRGRPTPRTSL